MVRRILSPAMLAATAVLLSTVGWAGAAEQRFASGTDTLVYTEDPGADPDPVAAGPSALVCLTPTSPDPCPIGAYQWMHPAEGWPASLSVIPGARWIWAPSDREAPGDDARRWFVTIVDVATPPDGEATLWVTSDDYAEVRVNGTFIAAVGSVTWPEDSASNAQLTALDIGAHVRQGRNVVTVLAQNGPSFFSPFCSDACTYRENPAGVVFGGRIGLTVPPTGTCFDLVPTIVGSSGNDHLVGTPGDDVIAGGAGRDTIAAGNGDDVVCGGAGADRVTGGNGVDRISGGDDEIRSRADAGLPTNDGADRLDGNYGVDVLFGEDGEDVLYGGPYGDTLRGGRGADRLHGGTGADGLVAGLSRGDVSGRDVLLGDQGDDVLWGSGDRDVLLGGLGGDFLNGADGRDTVMGGRGADRAQPLFSPFSGDPADVEDTGDDLVRGGDGDDVLDGGPGFDEVRGEDNIDTCRNAERRLTCERS